mgnify:CR=1 FL=1
MFIVGSVAWPWLAAVEASESAYKMLRMDYRFHILRHCHGHCRRRYRRRYHHVNSQLRPSTFLT